MRGDRARAVEDRHVHRGFHLVEGGVVLGVEEAGIRGGEEHGGQVARPLQPRGAEVEGAVPCESRGELGAFGAGQQGGVAEMEAGAGVAEDVREEDALVDLDAVLVALVEAGFGGDLPLGRDEAGHQRGGAPGQLVHAEEARAAGRGRIVDPIGVRGQEALARCAGRRQHRSGRRGLGGPPLRLLRQRADQAAGLGPEGAVARDVRLVGAGLAVRGAHSATRAADRPAARSGARGSSLIREASGRRRAWPCPGSARSCPAERRARSTTRLSAP